MRFFFHPYANEELDKAVQYYENCQIGLGLDFAEEVYAAIARIIKYPESWSLISTNTRRCLINRFPYGVIFQIKSDTIRIIAVANLHQKPGYWKDRI
ncbi:MAG: type II toxin-antitoxin system RelE/ParE family toxin [Spartobacteria bacterium]|nr:type II toxin-antitoxin system RelE/ParE family toxin [Spartobacteria bacterium]